MTELLRTSARCLSEAAHLLDDAAKDLARCDGFKADFAEGESIAAV